MVGGKGKGKGKGKETNKQIKSEPSLTIEIPNDNIENNKVSGVTNLQGSNPPVPNVDGNQRKSTITENADDEKQTKNDEVTKLKTLNQHLLNTITKERQEREQLKNKLKDCNDEARESHERMTEEWNTCKADFESKVAGLQNELNETKMFRKEQEEVCIRLKQERDVLEKKLKEFNDATQELQDKMTEERCRWDTYQENVSGLHNKLETANNEWNMLNHKHEELCTIYTNEKNEFEKSNDESKKLIAKMTEDQRLWDSCRQNLEGKVAELQNEISEIRKSSEEHKELCTQLGQEKFELENKLKKSNDGSEKVNAKMTEEKRLWDTCKAKLESTVAGLQNELNETRLLREELEKLCTQLRQEKDDMEDKLNARMKLLQAKMDEDSCLLGTCKANLEGKVAEMQNEYNEIRILSQEHKQLCTELKNEKNELENKLKDYNDENKNLKEKMIKNGHLWDACKAKLEGTVAGLQTEFKEHEELCTQLKQEKVESENKLKEYNEESRELKGKMIEDGLLWDSCKAMLEGSIVGLQNKLNESRMLREEHEELCTQLKQEKVELENKLNEYNEEIEKLKTRITEDGCFWDSCKANLEGKVTGLENELIEIRMLSQRNEELCTQLRQEKIELENKVKEDNDVNKKLQAKMTEDGCLWDNCKANLEVTVAKLENELNETRTLSQKHEELCTQLTQEKVEIENKLKKCYDGIKKLFANSTEKERFWDACKGKLEGTVEVLKNELNEKVKFIQEHEHLCTQLRHEKSELEKKLKESNDVTKKLNAKMTEDGRLWNTCKVNLEERIAGLESELDKIKIFSQKHEELCTQLRLEKHGLENKLKECNEKTKELKAKLTENGQLWDSCKANLEGTITELKNNLNKTKIMSQKREQDRIRLQNKLKECNEETKKLKEKLAEDSHLWDSCKENLEGTAAELQIKLDKASQLCEKNEELCIQLRNEKNDLENKLKKCYQGNKKLYAKTTEDRHLWDACKASLEGTVLGLQNELNETKIMSQKHEELCTVLRREKNELQNKLKECNDGIKELNEKITEDGKLWDSCKANLEGKVASLQYERRILSQEHEELCSHLREEKNKLQNKLKECNEETKKLKEKLVEDRHLWDSCKENLEGTAAELQIKLDKASQLCGKNEELCIQLRNEKNDLENKLKNCCQGNKKLYAKTTEDRHLWDACKARLEGTVSGLQNELNETKIMSQKHEELCTVLRQEKNELQNKLKECNDGIKELNEKITEEGKLWDSCKANLEGKVAGLQYERRILSQEHEELCSHLREEKNKLQNKLKECNKEIKKLKEKLAEDSLLWDSCKENLEGMAAELQIKLDKASQLCEKNEELCIQLRNEKNDLENKLKNCCQGNKKLYAKTTEDRHLWDACKASLEGTVSGLQNELNETKIMSQKREELCTVLRQEKNELQNKLKECNDGIKELNEKITEDGKFWDSCKANLEGKVAGLQYERRILSQEHEELCSHLREEKNKLQNKLKECNKEIKKLKEKLAEDSLLWDSGKENLEGTAAELQIKLDKASQLCEKNEELCIQLRNEKNDLENKLKNCCQGNKKLYAKTTEDRHLWDACKASLEGMVSGLQNELNETKIMSQKHEELCTVLRQEKNELQNKLKECNDGIKELNEKITEDGKLWDSCKANLEGEVAGLQYERRILSQEHEELCSHLREEKNKLQNKLKECNQGRRKLQAKMTEDSHLWKTGKADLEATVAGLKNELDLMTNEGTILCQKYEELCIECAFLNAQLGDYKDTLSSVEDERLGLSSLSESNAKRVEGLKTRLHLITSEGKQLTQKFEEVVAENKSLKKKMEDCIHQCNLVEKERKSLITMSASSDKRVEVLVEENSLPKQEIHELQNKLDMGSSEGKLNLVEGERQLLTSLSTSSDKMVEDLVTENRALKQEAQGLNQQNQLLQKNVFNKMSLLQTQAGIVGGLNAENGGLKNEIEKIRRSLEEMKEENAKVLQENGALKIKFKEAEEQRKRSGGRDSYKSQSREERDAFHEIFKSIILPPDALFSGCPFGWCGGIV